MNRKFAIGSNRLSAWILALAALTSGCAATAGRQATPVSKAWQGEPAASTERSSWDVAAPSAAPRPQPVAADDTIATVNDRPVSRQLLYDVLLRSHGAVLLEQLIGLQAAWQAAAERGLQVTDGDIEAERDRSLRRLIEAGNPDAPTSFDRRSAEQLLDAVLAQRNMARDEFDIVVRRNAHLRKIVESEMTITEEQIREEYDRTRGPRAQVRHIQSATLADAQRVKERLDAGEEFAEVAARYSANRVTAEAQGRLDPFSRDDPEVPEVLREAAFALQPGQISAILRAGQWYHVLQLERILPADETPLDQARDAVERSMRDRLSEPAMYQLFEKLFRSARIDVRDPDLRAAFERKHPERAR